MLVPRKANVKAVLPMNQYYTKGTGPKISKLEAAAEGTRTSTTRNNLADNIAIRRLQPGDTVLFTGKDNALYGTVTGKGTVDPLIFDDTPQGRQARINYAQGEGGNEQYARHTLLGTGKDKGLGAGANILYYDAKGDLIPTELLPPEHQALIAQRNQYTPDEHTSGEGLFYKDTMWGWDKPATAASTAPMLNADRVDPTYSPETLAANNIVLVDGKPHRVQWYKPKGATEADRYPTIYIDGLQVPVKGENKVLLDKYGNKPEMGEAPSFKIINKDSFKYPQDRTNLPMRNQMQTLGQEMSEINRLMSQTANVYDPYAPPTVREVYYGSPTEPGLKAIQENARRGGSGSWVNDRQGEDFNLFQANIQSQGDSMLAQDYARGGTRISGGGITPAYPAVEERDFVGDRVRYNSRGFLVDAQGSRSIPQAVRALTPASEFYTNTPQVNRDLRTGEIIRGTSNPVLRPETYDEVPLTPVTTNEYGLAIAEPLQQGRIARSVRLRNNDFPVDTREKVFLPDYNSEPISNYGRLEYTGTWEDNPNYGQAIDNGGRPFLVSRYKDEKTNYQAPLNSYYKIPGDYRPMLSPADKRVFDALLADQEARQLAAATPEDIQPAFTRQYTIQETGKQIQPQFKEDVIPGAYMPVTYEGSKGVNVPGYAPFVPSQAAASQQIGDGVNLLDAHLANVLVEVDGRKYPLTPEATTTEYITSEKQLSNETTARHGAVRITRDGDWMDIEPTDAELAVIQKDGVLNFSPGDDIKDARAKGVGLSNEIYADPNLSPMDAQGAIAETKRKLNRIQAGINNQMGVTKVLPNGEKIYYPPSPTAQLPASSTNVINPGDAYRNQHFVGANEQLGQVVKLIDPDGNVSYRPADSFTKKKVVIDIDGNEYIEDASYLSKKDLANAFDTGEGTNYSVLPSYLQSEINRAESAVNQLMNLEAQPEVQIVAPIKKASTLREQAKQLGMRVRTAYRESDPESKFITVKGSIPFGQDIELPVKYNQQQSPIDQVEQAIVSKGKSTQQIVDIGNLVRPKQPDTRQIQALSNFEVVDSPGTTITLPDGRTKLVPGTRQIIDKRPPVGEGADYDYYFTPTKQVQSGRRVVDRDSYQPDWSQAYISGERPELTPEQQQRANEAIAKIAPWSQPQPMLVSPSADTYVANEIAQAVTQPRPITAADTVYFDEAMQRRPYNKSRRQQQWGEAVAVPEPPQESRFVEDYGRMYRGGRLPRSPQLTPVGDDRYQQLIATDIAAPVVVEPMQEPQYLTMRDLMPYAPYTSDNMVADMMASRRGQPMSYVGGSYVEPELPPQPIPPAPSALPSWAIPAGLGGIYLGAAGINAWQQEQERQRQQEQAQLQRLILG